MRIHIAARHEQRERASKLAHRLEAAGHRVISRWLARPASRRTATIAENARYALNDVVLSECVVFLAESPWEAKAIPGASDRHVEIGYALKANKRVCLLGPRETAFFHLEEVERYQTVEELVDGLR